MKLGAVLLFYGMIGSRKHVNTKHRKWGWIREPEGFGRGGRLGIPVCLRNQPPNYRTEKVVLLCIELVGAPANGWKSMKLVIALSGGPNIGP